MRPPSSTPAPPAAALRRRAGGLRPRQGGALCRNCRRGRPLSAEALELLRRILGGELGTVLAGPPPPGRRRRWPRWRPRRWRSTSIAGCARCARSPGSEAAVAPAVLWFRRDLRLGDHPALTEAARLGRAPTACCRSSSLDDACSPRPGPRRAAFLAAEPRRARGLDGRAAGASRAGRPGPGPRPARGRGRGPARSSSRPTTPPTAAARRRSGGRGAPRPWAPSWSAGLELRRRPGHHPLGGGPPLQGLQRLPPPLGGCRARTSCCRRSRGRLVAVRRLGC